MNGIEIIDLEDLDDIPLVRESEPSGVIDNQQAKLAKLCKFDNLVTANKYLISDLEDDDSDAGFCEIIGLSNAKPAVPKISTVIIPSSPTSYTTIRGHEMAKEIFQDNIVEKDLCEKLVPPNKNSSSHSSTTLNKSGSLSTNVIFKSPGTKDVPHTILNNNKVLKLDRTVNEVIELLDDSDKSKFQNKRKNNFSDDIIIIDENYIATEKELHGNMKDTSSKKMGKKQNKLFTKIASDFAKKLPSSPDTIHRLSSGITDPSSSPVSFIKTFENKNLTEKLRAINGTKVKKNTAKKCLQSTRGSPILRSSPEKQIRKESNDKPSLLSDSSIQNSSDGVVIENTNRLNLKPRQVAKSPVCLDCFTESNLDFMLQEAKLKNPNGLKKVNKVTSTKETLTRKMICCFSTSLDKELRILNDHYPEFLKPLDFSTFESDLPIIKLQRKVDSVYYQTKMIYIPIPLHLEDEDVIILCYDSKDLPKLIQEHDMMKAIKKLREEKSGYKIVIFLNEYEKFLRKLNSDIQKDFKEQVSQRLQGEEQAESSRKRRKVNECSRIQPDKVVDKLIGYEIKFDVHFFPHDGLNQLFEWLIPMAYTTSSRYTDNLERNINHSNIGKVKSGVDPTASFIQMINQIKGMTDIKSKKFVKESKYNSVGKLFDRLKNSNRLNDECKLIRNDIEKAMKIVFLSNDENELIN